MNKLSNDYKAIMKRIINKIKRLSKSYRIAEQKRINNYLNGKLYFGVVKVSPPKDLIVPGDLYFG